MTPTVCSGCFSGYRCHIGTDAAGALIPTPSCACGKYAWVSVRLKPHKSGAFTGNPETRHSCPACLESVKALGTVLSITGIGQPKTRDVEVGG